MAVIFLTTPGLGTWTVPSDCAVAKFECIGGGAGGFTQSPSLWGSGGGAGAYSAATAVSLTSGATVFLSIGAGGGANTAGGDTWINKSANSAPTVSTDGALAKSGLAATSNGTVGGAGGAAGACVGNVTASGGAGGSSVNVASGGGGGGGAGGRSGNGQVGGPCPGVAVTYGGGGGGGANGGASTQGAASASGGVTGGAGGVGTSGAGSGSSGGGAGATGGGGGGGDGSLIGAATAGGAGGSDTAIDATHGFGGGGGGGGGTNSGASGSGGAGGGYGGGGGGGGYGGAGAAGAGGNGAQGLIVITYTSNNICGFRPFEPASRPITAVLSQNFSGFGFSLPPVVQPPSRQRFFSQWETAKTRGQRGADFAGYAIQSSRPQRLFSKWDAQPRKSIPAADFQSFIARPAPIVLRRFDQWTAAPRPISQAQISTFGGFVRIPPVILPDIDAVYRPRKKDLAKSKPQPRPDYSIYNHPDAVQNRQEQPPFEGEDGEELPESEPPIAAVLIVDAAPTVEGPRQEEDPGHLLPMEHLGLLKHSWSHAIAAPPLAPTPETQAEQDPDADDVFSAIIQNAMGGRGNGEDYRDVIRALKTIMVR